MLLKPWGVRFCPALPTTLPGWNASRNYACWTYFWRCIDYLWDVPSRRIKSFMCIPEKGGLNLSKGFFWDWRNENNTLFIFVLLAFTQRTWHTYIHTYTHTHPHAYTCPHTHTPPKQPQSVTSCSGHSCRRHCFGDSSFLAWHGRDIQWPDHGQEWRGLCSVCNCARGWYIWGFLAISTNVIF